MVRKELTSLITANFYLWGIDDTFPYLSSFKTLNAIAALYGKTH